MRFLSIPQYGQPNKYTCGATAMTMQLVWESHKVRTPQPAYYFPMMQVYNSINTSGGPTSGLTAPELKVGLGKVINDVNGRYGLGINLIMAEGKFYTIRDAVVHLHINMQRNYSPAFIYGNVNIIGSQAGGHYYLAIGTVMCLKTHGCSSDYYGLYLHDSVYGSPAYPWGSIVQNQAISPGKYMSDVALSSYWKKTGHWNPFLRKHIYYFNGRRSL